MHLGHDGAEVGETSLLIDSSNWIFFIYLRGDEEKERKKHSELTCSIKLRTARAGGGKS